MNYSREGEIAIAKRIEAGKDVMLIALSQSPLTAQQFLTGTKNTKGSILVREIIDIDTNYMEDETTGPSAKQKIQVRQIKTKIRVIKMKMILIQHLPQWVEIKPKVLKQ